MPHEKTNLLVQFQSISNKLRKKRILKKPNVSEACQQFEQLGVNFEREELYHYAGWCYQAAAKCQNSLGNTLEEGYLLLKASRQFLKNYLKNVNVNTVPHQTYLHYSYKYYHECIARLQSSKDCNSLIKDTIIGSIVLEMGNNLNDKAGLIEEACQEFEKGLKIYSNFPAEKIHCLQKIVSSKIELGDYAEALKLINEIVEEASLLFVNKTKEDILCEAEISRIFLLLILQPTPQQLSRVAAAALEKYAWVETSNINEGKDLQMTLKDQGLSMLGEDLFLKLQSLVMACQYCDTESLEPLEVDLIPHLNNEQRTLLHVLIKQYKT